MSNKLSYYDFSKLFSYNATFNFVLGSRGLGKTYGAKKQAIRNYIKRGEQFIYLRRFETELKGRGTFFADIAYEFPEYGFRVKGRKAEMCRNPDAEEDKRNWEIIGYFTALSNAVTQKSIAYPLVTLIIFDEFIIETGLIHYLPAEHVAFNDFYSTVDRWKDKTTVLFLANSISIMNPYFIEYDISPDKNREFVRSHGGFICAHFADSEVFATEVYKTNFGQFIKGTEYAKYSVKSEFKDNNDNLLRFKNNVARYFLTIESKQGIFSVWHDRKENIFYAQEKRPKNELFFTLEPSLMDENKVLLERSDKFAQLLRTAFRQGRLFFDSARTRNAYAQIFKR